MLETVPGPSVFPTLVKPETTQSGEAEPDETGFGPELYVTKVLRTTSIATGKISLFMYRKIVFASSSLGRLDLGKIVMCLLLPALIFGLGEE